MVFTANWVYSALVMTSGKIAAITSSTASPPSLALRGPAAAAHGRSRDRAARLGEPAFTVSWLIVASLSRARVRRASTRRTRVHWALAALRPNRPCGRKASTSTSAP